MRDDPAVTESRRRTARLQRAAVYLGLIEVPGQPRSKWARVVNVKQDSSRAEALVGLTLAVLVLVLVVLRLLDGPWWFRPVAGFASLILLLNLVRLLRSVRSILG